MKPRIEAAQLSYAERAREHAARWGHLRVCEPGERAPYQRADWRAADKALRKIARVRVGLEAAEAKWLLVALRTKVWAPLGMGSIIEYLERTLGYKPRDAYERLRVAEALEPLSEMTSALKRGVFAWSAVRELTRVAVPETEVEWIEAARGKTVREIEAMVSGRRPGDRPTDPASWDAKRHIISFEVSGTTRALFREAMDKVRRDAGSRLDDDSALAMVARQILRGPTDEGRASHQIVVMKCPECGRMGQESGGALVPLDPIACEVAECDAQVIDLDTHAHTHVGGTSKIQTPVESGRRSKLTHVGNRTEVPTVPSASASMPELTHVGEMTEAPTEREASERTHVGNQCEAPTPPNASASTPQLTHVGEKNRGANEERVRGEGRR